MRRSTLKYGLVAALAAGTMAASAAQARPTDRADRFDSPTSSLAGTTTGQDLRGEHARDAARLAEQPQDLRGEHAQDAARFNGRPMRTQSGRVPAPVKVVPAAKTGGGDDDLWLVLGIGLGTAGIVAGSAVAMTRSRVRTRRAIA
jgi:hypothetical protein